MQASRINDPIDGTQVGAQSLNGLRIYAAVDVQPETRVGQASHRIMGVA
jgi:hypothetical protein